MFPPKGMLSDKMKKQKTRHNQLTNIQDIFKGNSEILADLLIFKMPETWGNIKILMKFPTS